MRALFFFDSLCYPKFTFAHAHRERKIKKKCKCHSPSFVIHMRTASANRFQFVRNPIFINWTLLFADDVFFLIFFFYIIFLLLTARNHSKSLSKCPFERLCSKRSKTLDFSVVNPNTSNWPHNEESPTPFSCFCCCCTNTYCNGRRRNQAATKPDGRFKQFTTQLYLCDK